MWKRAGVGGLLGLVIVLPLGNPGVAAQDRYARRDPYAEGYERGLQSRQRYADGYERGVRSRKRRSEEYERGSQGSRSQYSSSQYVAPREPTPAEAAEIQRHQRIGLATSCTAYRNALSGSSMGSFATAWLMRRACCESTAANLYGTPPGLCAR